MTHCAEYDARGKMGRTIHVLPAVYNDKWPHIAELGCWCMPEMEAVECSCGECEPGILVSHRKGGPDVHFRHSVESFS